MNVSVDESLRSILGPGDGEGVEQKRPGRGADAAPGKAGPGTTSAKHVDLFGEHADTFGQLVFGTSSLSLFGGAAQEPEEDPLIAAAKRSARGSAAKPGTPGVSSGVSRQGSGSASGGSAPPSSSDQLSGLPGIAVSDPASAGVSASLISPHVAPPPSAFSVAPAAAAPIVAPIVAPVSAPMPGPRPLLHPSLGPLGSPPSGPPSTGSGAARPPLSSAQSRPLLIPFSSAPSSAASSPLPSPPPQLLAAGSVGGMPPVPSPFSIPAGAGTAAAEGGYLPRALPPPPALATGQARGIVPPPSSHGTPRGLVPNPFGSAAGFGGGGGGAPQPPPRGAPASQVGDAAVAIAIAAAAPAAAAAAAPADVSGFSGSAASGPAAVGGIAGTLVIPGASSQQQQQASPEDSIEAFFACEVAAPPVSAFSPGALGVGVPPAGAGTGGSGAAGPGQPAALPPIWQPPGSAAASPAATSSAPSSSEPAAAGPRAVPLPIPLWRPQAPDIALADITYLPEWAAKGAWAGIRALCEASGDVATPDYRASDLGSTANGVSLTGTATSTSTMSQLAAEAQSKHRSDAIMLAYLFAAQMQLCEYPEARFTLQRLQGLPPLPAGFCFPFALELLAAELPFFEGKALAALQQLSQLDANLCAAAAASASGSPSVSDLAHVSAASSASSGGSSVSGAEWFVFPSVCPSSSPSGAQRLVIREAAGGKDKSVSLAEVSVFAYPSGSVSPSRWLVRRTVVLSRIAAMQLQATSLSSALATAGELVRCCARTATIVATTPSDAAAVPAKSAANPAKSASNPALGTALATLSAVARALLQAGRAGEARRVFAIVERSLEADADAAASAAATEPASLSPSSPTSVSSSPVSLSPADAPTAQSAAGDKSRTRSTSSSGGTGMDSAQLSATNVSQDPSASAAALCRDIYCLLHRVYILISAQDFAQAHMQMSTALIGLAARLVSAGAIPGGVSRQHEYAVTVNGGLVSTSSGSDSGGGSATSSTSSSSSASAATSSAASLGAQLSALAVGMGVGVGPGLGISLGASSYEGDVVVAPSLACVQDLVTALAALGLVEYPPCPAAPSPPSAPASASASASTSASDKGAASSSSLLPSQVLLRGSGAAFLSPLTDLVNCYAVVSAFRGHLARAEAILEVFVRAAPAVALSSTTTVANLRAAYDLTAFNSDRRKRTLSALLARFARDGLVAELGNAPSNAAVYGSCCYVRS